MSACFITRVRLKNFKSIASCDVALRPLTFLVGPNGSGKSNFLDALRLVRDGLRFSLDHAMRERGGVKEIRRRSAGHPTHFEIDLCFRLPGGQDGRYRFRIGAPALGEYEVQSESLEVDAAEGLGRSFFKVQRGEVVESSVDAPPAASLDRLYLVNASGMRELRPVYDALSRMGFYNLNPDSIRDLQDPDSGELLARDGSNLAAVYKRLEHDDRARVDRIEEYLARVVPGVSGVEAKSLGHKETLEFRQAVTGAANPWRFPATSVSDGTLRALGVLVALFQFSNGQRKGASLVGIEEPEAALHPAAAGVLLGALREASETTQVLVTSHSPDLLDDENIATDSLLAVSANAGATQIAPIDPTGRGALRDRLYTAGELLRLDQLRPDPELVDNARYVQSTLFAEDSTE
ncbi:MAG: AAA family ATPase [Actinomycetes bacterium]